MIVTNVAEQIQNGTLHACCLREENLYLYEHEAWKLVRVCRVCHRRHIRMAAPLGDLKMFLRAPTKAIYLRDGKRFIKMPAPAGVIGS